MTTNKNSTRYYSSKQEKTVARKFKGKTVANSGAAKFVAGDVDLGNILVECKTATKDVESMSIKREWIEKLKEESFAMGKQYWTLVFNFGQVLSNTENFYIIDERMFKQLLDTLKTE